METIGDEANVGIPTNKKMTEREVEVIRHSFTEPVLKAVRNLFFGLEVTDDQKALVRTTFADPEAYAIMRRKLYPEIDPATPLGQTSDVWLGVEKMVFGYDRDTIAQAIGYKERALDMTAKALELLKNPNAPRASMVYTPPQVTPDGQLATDPLAIELMARNQFVRHIESQLTILMVVASQAPKDQTPKVAGKVEKDKKGNPINKDSAK